MQVSDKETRAVFLNFKELRYLEKNLQSLDLEKAYSISLINLDQKIVKLSNKRLRDKVAKIKSYLPESDVDELRWLDKIGKLGTSESPSKSNSKVRIAAAEKRLKLQPRAKSAKPRLETEGASITTTPRSALSARRCSTRLQSARAPSTTPRSIDLSKNKNQLTIDSRSQASAEDMSDFPVPRSVREDRKKSICVPAIDGDDVSHGKKFTPRQAFVNNKDETANKPNDTCNNNNNYKDMKTDIVTIKIDQAEDESSAKLTDQSPDIKYVKTNPQNVSFLGVPDTADPVPSSNNKDINKIRPISVPATKVTSFSDENRRAFTSMSHLNDVRKKCAANIRRASRLLASGKTKSPFSCHNNIDNEDKAKSKEKPFRSIRDGVYAEIEKGPMENTLGTNLHKEIKRGLMLGEVATSLQLEDKIDTYMDKVQNYVKENPTAWEPYVPENDSNYYSRGQSADAKSNPKDKSNVKHVRNKARRQQLEFKLRQGAANDIFLQNNFSDIKKSRYLRIPDSMIDLSGVNTLAIDQVRMFGTMKTGATWADESQDENG